MGVHARQLRSAGKMKEPFVPRVAKKNIGGRLQSLTSPVAVDFGQDVIEYTGKLLSGDDAKLSSFVSIIINYYSEFANMAEIDYDEVTERLIDINEHNMKYLEGTLLDKRVILDLASCFDIKPRFIPRLNIDSDIEEQDVFPQAPVQSGETRPAVISIMGHVDHGKTTLLDALRSSRIVDSEHGGITQHIGAFSVQMKNNNGKITFLDTPGHSAFKAMRQRGAKCTDIVVLVVAADDGVKEQTVESIRYAKDANVPIVVAINKCDKPNADTNYTRRSLMEHEIVVEDMGGDVQVVEISALYNKNIDKLQEALITLSEMLELRSTSRGLSEGVVIESSAVQGLGKICTIIVQRGTLRKGSIVVCGTTWAKVKTITDEFGKTIKEAGPSTPVRITGWRGDTLPAPGDTILEVDKEEKAQKVVNYRLKVEQDKLAEKDWKSIEGQREEDRQTYLKNRQKLLNKGIRYSSTLRRVVHRNERFSKDSNDNNDPKLNLMLRADVDGTLEALLNVLDTYKSKQCELNLVDFGVGPPIDNHIELAIETNSLIYCFNTPINANIRELALKSNIKLEQFLVIYRLIDALKAELSSKLEPLKELNLVGEGHIIKEFMISDRDKKKQPIAGTLVDWGTFDKNRIFRLSRQNTPYYEGVVESLKSGNAFVNQVKTNQEVGIALTDKKIRFKEDDLIEVFEQLETPQTIEWMPPGF
uniref:Tr-type G domain-containing protein n=1 Tax=Rhabditophanes sp. KR3021 TaxID=114890 RepID=A0AC35UHR8_9BILA